MHFKQTYKNTAEAFRLFIAAQNLPVKQAKFYQDVDRLSIKNPDKSIDLAALLVYVKDELKIDLSTGRSLIERDMEKERENLDLEEKRLKVEKLRKENRKEDRDWLHREKVEEREGALVGAIMSEVRYQLDREAPAVITACGGKMEKLSAVKKINEAAAFAAFRTLYEAGEIDITFEEEEE